MSTDPLHFTDTKPYRQRLETSMQATGLRDAPLARRAPRDLDAQPAGAHECSASPLDDAEAGEQRPAVARRLARGDDERVAAGEPVQSQRGAVACVPELDHVVEREAGTVDPDLVWHRSNGNTAARSESRELRCTGHARPDPDNRGQVRRYLHPGSFF